MLKTVRHMEFMAANLTLFEGFLRTSSNNCALLFETMCVCTT